MQSPLTPSIFSGCLLKQKWQSAQNEFVILYVQEISFKATEPLNTSYAHKTGHEKYLKTTLFGLTGLMPDYCLLVVGSNMGVQMMTREHISIACALNIPMFVAVTKIDICPPK